MQAIEFLEQNKLISKEIHIGKVKFIMKKKILTLLMAVSVAVLAFAGCGSTTGEETFGDEDSATEDITYYVSVQTRGFDEALLLVTSDDGSGEIYVEETGSYGWMGAPGQTLGEMMEEWGVKSIEATCNGQEFLGWIAYETKIITDENGFEETVETPLFDGKVFTTEEIMTQELPEADVTFYTVWDLVCGGCEENKICEVYYIDDEIYYVCNDCYEEFATGMGLLE